MKAYLPQRRIQLLALVLLAGSLFLGWCIRPLVTTAAGLDPVTAAWEKARAAGNYHFTSDVTQVTLPVATLTNVGRTSRTEKMHLEGQNDLQAERLEFTLWSDGGSTLEAASGLGIRSEKGKTFARRKGEDWKPVDDVTGAIAPQGDFMSYLAAIKHVQAQPAEQRGGIHFTRYTFQIDSPRFAEYMHQQMEAALRARGELPATLNLAVPTYFRDMVGTGELWVGKDGLPLRQILTLQFPAQNDEQVNSQIVVDFAKFGSDKPVGSGQSSVGSEQWPVVSRWLDTSHWSLLTAHFIPSMLFLTLLTGAVLLLYYRRARRFHAWVVILLIFAEVAGPVLTTYTNVKFFDAQTAKAATQKEEQAAAKNERTVRDALGKVAFNPHVNPLETERQGDKETGGQGDKQLTRQSRISNLQTAPATLLTDNGVDTDGDGLTDFAEERIGTSSVMSDTDGDGVPDGVEVKGFDYGGQHWYTDPQATDSNGDGLTDGLEWGYNADGSLRATPQDTDGDGIPDLFDDDNDNDGVPDNKDLAPFTKGAATYTEAAPLQLTINNLAAGQPTFVEFQIRPQDPKQLWYAFNVLDWPQDSAGQMRDIDGKTYADVATASGRMPDASDANGDMKVVPMLEIRIPLTSANLPPQSDLTPFNITVNNLTADGQTKVAYVPLSIITDEKTGQRVAFSGQMRYLPTGFWNTPHEVRLAWVVQALDDVPCDKTDNAQVARGCQSDGYYHNVPQMLQSYYGNWNLTGLTMREDHGSDMAIVYEDPTVDPNPKDDAALWGLAYALDQHFVQGHDADNNGVRDLKLADFPARFDHTNNPSDAQRFGVPNILKVALHSYPTLDAAIASTTMTETATILNTVFKPYVESDRAIKPLLLFAQENRTRFLNLDLGTAGGGFVNQTGNGLTLDLAPSPATALPVDVNAGMKWMGYCAPATGAVTLTPCNDDDYWATLETRYANLPAQPDDQAADWVGGRVMMTQAYYTGLRSGYFANVQRGAQILSFNFRQESEADTSAVVRAVLQPLSAVPLLAAENFYRLFPLYRFFANPADASKSAIKSVTVDYYKILRTVLNENQAKVRNPTVGRGEDPVQVMAKVKRQLSRTRFQLGRFNIARLGVAGTVYMVLLQIASLIPDLPNNTRTGLGAFAIALNILINVVQPIVTLVYDFRVGFFTSLARFSESQHFLGRGAAIGAVISVALIWGFFIYGAVTSGLAPGTPQFNRALIETVVATVVTILLAVLSANPIGAIIATILGIVDAILSLICESGVKELRDVPGQDGACFTVTGALTKALAKLLYSYDLMIDLSRGNLMLTGAPQVALARPSLGYIAGNTLSVTLPITTTIIHKDPDADNSTQIQSFMYLFSPENLMRSSFQYTLTNTGNATLPVHLGEMTKKWQHVQQDHTYSNSPMYRGDMATTPAPIHNVPLPLGINATIPITINMSYAIPAYECWATQVPICYTRAFTGDNHLPITALQYDVFPPTLDEFFAMSGKPSGGLGLAWDARFPALRDADGDGLLSSVYGGLDPDDSTVDADHDGLTDRFELEQRAAGVALSPIQCDTDGDGLTDAQELRLGTNPAVADSDNDGLLDGEEVWHQVYDTATCTPALDAGGKFIWAGGWDVQINAATPFTIHVSSDPLNADGDNDGVNDLAERQLAQDPNPANRVDNQNRPYNPNVLNSPPLAVLVETDALGNYLAPGQKVAYTTTVIANTAVVSGVLNVNAPSQLGGAVNPLALAFNPLTFTSTQTVTQCISLTVASAIGTQATRITSTVNTRLPNTGAPGWAFAPITAEPPLGVTPPNTPYFSAVTASRPDRQDNYLLAATTIQSAGPIGFGDISAYTVPTGTVRAIENDNGNTTALMDTAPPSIATNANGDSLAVWGQQRYCNKVTINSLKVVTAGPDQGTPGIEPFLTFQTANANEQQIWYWKLGTGGSDDVKSGTQFGPNGGDFPITLPFCGGSATLRLYESNGLPLTDHTLNPLLDTKFIDVFTPPPGGLLTFIGGGSTIEVNVTLPVIDDNVIAGALLGSDGAIKRSLSFPQSPVPTSYKRGNFTPVVASDGTNFLVAYESFTQDAHIVWGKPQIVVQGFDAAGNPLSNSYQDAGSSQMSSGGAELAASAAWIGSGYRLIWQDQRAGTVYRADVTANGQAITTPTRITVSALSNAGLNHAPGIAYDPISGRTLLMYPLKSRQLLGWVYQGNTLVAGPKGINLAQFPAARSPQVVWQPGYQGWLLSYQDDTASQRHVFVPLNKDADPAFPATTGFFIAANDNSLACPAPQSAAVTDLRFEELPAPSGLPTTFNDSSGRGNNATCTGTTCPAAGVPGAPNAPLSDYAVQFDGVDDGLTLNRAIQDDFSIAFWLKAPPSSGQKTLVDGGNIASNGFAVRLNNGGVLVYAPGLGFQTSRRVDDNQWHFVVISRQQASGQVNIYLDGALARGLPGTPEVSLNNTPTLTIGRKPDGTLALSAILDHLQIFPVALAADSVQGIFNRTQQAYCVAAGTSNNNVYWAKVKASQQDTRGGRLTASAGLTLTIDSDLPTAQFAAIQNNAIVGPGQVIGGTASDPTSGVGLVEVSINNGDWQAATGANSWAFSLAGQSGAISARVRATDNVGNVGDPSTPLNLTVDNAVPVVTIDTPPATVKPTPNANGVWHVNLSGTASDASVIKPDSLLVRLEQQSGVGMAQTPQQATLNGATWSIAYQLTPGLYDPTGAYTVTVQAADSVGHQALPATAILRLDARGPEAALSSADIARGAISQTLTIGGVVSDTDSIAGIDKLEIAFTPVEQIAALPGGLTSTQAEAQLQRTWTPVTLAQHGAGVTTTSWSFAIPTGLEDLYQIDLRGTDMLGNAAISSKRWRGAIDTTAPRLVMKATPTGTSYFDAASNQRLYALSFLCAAVDRNLVEATLTCPVKGLTTPTRTFTTTSEMQALFPGLTIRNGLAFSYTGWQPTITPAVTMSACDSFGHCATANTTTAAAAQQTPTTVTGTPNAVIVAPTAGSFVAASNGLSITVAAEADALIKTVIVRLDDGAPGAQVVQTLNFAQSDAVTHFQRTVSINGLSEGPHTLVAQATDWAGVTQATLFPVPFTLDTAAPRVTIDTSPLTNAATWQAQSGVLRFSGTENDSVGLAAVQVRIDDGVFSDATFGDGVWHVALYVPNPEGRTLNVTARATDRAGRITEVTQQVATDLSASDAPDTSISSSPANPSAVNSVTFGFTGTASAVMFACQLDDSTYQPCASPQAYNDLSKGSHLFRVRAIDSRGFADLSPAEYTWTVNASQPDVTLTGKPTNPTTEPDANFVFTGDATTSRFVCSLDGSAYTACTSPQNYTGLGFGKHSFLVRALTDANQAGAPERYTWTVNNAPPVAADQSVAVNANQAKQVTLAATDSEPLVYTVVTPPAHGVLSGLAPGLTYTPDTNYVGSDSFTFKASDGLAESNIAAVALTMSQGNGSNGQTQKLFLPIIANHRAADQN